MHRPPFKRQDYTEFVKSLDESSEKLNKQFTSKPVIPKEGKENIDNLLLKIENEYETSNSEFYNDNYTLTLINHANYIDPNSYVYYKIDNKKLEQNADLNKKSKTPIINKPANNSDSENYKIPPTQSGIYSACIGYTSTISNIMKDEADKIKIKIEKEIKSYENNVYKSRKQYLNKINSQNQENLNKKEKPPLYIPPAKRIKKTKVNIEVEITNLDDLIKLIDDYPIDETKEYNINMEGLHKIRAALVDLNNMIGMKDLKENIVDQILYYIQDINKSGDFMHTVIYGPPGTGKTEIAKIIGAIFSKLGILKKGNFKKVTRSDLVAGYLGQTAMKTRDVINDCLGGVLFIDEAYALGNNDKKDSFSKECIDTLCEALSNHKDNLMVIIAGYEHELKECFFNYNQGLDSRFTWRFKTDEYKGEELFNIFLKKVKEINWEIVENDSNIKITKQWFEKNHDYFKFYGRDIETLLAKTKIVHARRVFCKPQNEKMKITLKDLEKGFALYLKNDEVKNRKDNENLKSIIKNTMYI